MARWKIALWLAAILWATAGCSWGAAMRSASTGSAKATLTIQIKAGARVLRMLTLGCSPPAGSSARPAAACAALRDYVRRFVHSHLVCHCPAFFADSRRALVTGTLDGRRLRLRFGPCACGVRLITDLRIVTGLRSFAPATS